MLGCRLPVPPALEPLYERYYCWKHGARESGSIHLDALCPYILALYQALADERGVPLAQAFRGTVYVVPPLKLAHHEAHQVAYFWERGLRVRIGGGMPSMGATAPVTLAGAVTLNLAEQLALRILDWALWGEKKLHLSSSISVMDMRTTIRPFGRPEMAIANLMMAQLARHYGASFSGHAGLSDAKLPSVEAGAQKMMTAVPTLLAGGSLWVDAGLLAIDEVCSPVQMILDNEWMGALQRFGHNFEVSEESIGLETVLEAGPGGHFLDKMHTVRHFREEHWNPTIWSRQMLRPWLEGDRRLDVDVAREIALEVQSEMKRHSLEPAMSDSLEREALRVIDQARRTLVH
jgi:trimethylamine:corrinoid methyltransferase-like protein